jgi:GNAT superfamily N-acetyltransferase
MPALPIRAAREDDAEAIAALIAEACALHVLPEFTVEGRRHFLDDHGPDAIRQRLAADFSYLVAEDAGALAGVVGIRSRNHLYDLFVAQTWQGRGLGRRLWDRALAQALNGGKQERFTVNASKYAVPVYERFGFVPVAPVQERNGVLFVPMELPLAASP